MWLRNVFRGEPHYDIVYISANPIINSRGIRSWDFDPQLWIRVHRIIDVWDFGWDVNLKTVHPREVYKAAIVASKLYRDRKLIVHFLQPHWPYIELSLKGILPSMLRREVKRRLIDRVRGFIRWKLIQLLGEEKGKKVAEKIVGPPPLPPNYIEIVARIFGIDELRRLYESNLRLVMEYVIKLVNALRNRGLIIVTSDHGELLGEYGLFEHSYVKDGWKYPELIEIPWLEIHSTI
jgi:hypothetical protein